MDSLLEPFHAACKPQSEFRVGTEAEKFGWLTDTREALPFAGPRSVQSVLSALVQRFGWAPERERPEGEVIALRREQSSITLEPAGQLELSAAPHTSVHETCREFRQHFAELHEVSRDRATDRVVEPGLQRPFAKQSELPNVPKLRYSIMGDATCQHAESVRST